MQKLPLVTCTPPPHKMRSAQTPFGAWAIMKKFILYALLSGSLISSLTVIKVYQSIMNKL